MSKKLSKTDQLRQEFEAEMESAAKLRDQSHNPLGSLTDAQLAMLLELEDGNEVVLKLAASQEKVHAANLQAQKNQAYELRRLQEKELDHRQAERDRAWDLKHRRYTLERNTRYIILLLFIAFATGYVIKNPDGWKEIIFLVVGLLGGLLGPEASKLVGKQISRPSE